MSKTIDVKMMCLDAAIRAPGIQEFSVIKQAKEYCDFVLGFKRPQHKPTVRKKK